MIVGCVLSGYLAISVLPSSPGSRHRRRARPGLGRDPLRPLLLLRGQALRVLRRRADQLPGNDNTDFRMNFTKLSSN